MKKEYILGLIAGASLMLAFLVLTGADDEDFRYEIVLSKYNDEIHGHQPFYLLDKETGEVKMPFRFDKIGNGVRKWVTYVHPIGHPISE